MELAHVVENGNLVSAEQWKQHIESLHVPVNKKSRKDSAQLILDSLTKAVQRRVKKKSAILLSGGLDSTMIAAIAPLPSVVVGTETSPDLAMARKAAKHYGIDLIELILTKESITDYVARTATIINETEDMVKLDIGATGLAALETAKQNNFKSVFTGLGAEEIFAGYQRHTTASDINEECWRGLADDLWRRDFSRDIPIANHVGIEALTPFLDQDLIKVAMSIPGSYKLNDHYRKVILREAALLAKVPEEFAWRRKLAMQYGSRVNPLFTKVASAQGLKKTELVKRLVENKKV